MVNYRLGTGDASGLFSKAKRSFTRSQRAAPHLLSAGTVRNLTPQRASLMAAERKGRAHLLCSRSLSESLWGFKPTACSAICLRALGYCYPFTEV